MSARDLSSRNDDPLPRGLAPTHCRLTFRRLGAEPMAAIEAPRSGWISFVSRRNTYSISCAWVPGSTPEDLPARAGRGQGGKAGEGPFQHHAAARFGAIEPYRGRRNRVSVFPVICRAYGAFATSRIAKEAIAWRRRRQPKYRCRIVITACFCRYLRKGFPPRNSLLSF